jgi:signal transduction histidine kinase
LNAVALETAILMGPAAIAAGKSVAVVEAARSVEVAGDANHIAIALRNLIENGLRAAPYGGTVEVTVDAAGTVAVADRGPGVPANSRERIFERFWRDDHAAEGAGLGLSIVRRIVEAHDGRIMISDVPGGGACFTLSFRPWSPPADNLAQM